MEQKELTGRIKQLIVRALSLPVDPEEIPEEEPLFGDGVGLDSVATLEIVFAVEEEFGIEVEDDDLRVELFASVATLAEYVRNRLGEKSAYPPSEA